MHMTSIDKMINSFDNFNTLILQSQSITLVPFPEWMSLVKLAKSSGEYNGFILKESISSHSLENENHRSLGSLELYFGSPLEHAVIPTVKNETDSITEFGFKETLRFDGRGRDTEVMSIIFELASAKSLYNEVTEETLSNHLRMSIITENICMKPLQETLDFIKNLKYKMAKTELSIEPNINLYLTENLTKDKFVPTLKFMIDFANNYAKRVGETSEYSVPPPIKYIG